jgi:integrase/recombinase XerD
LARGCSERARPRYPEDPARTACQPADAPLLGATRAVVAASCHAWSAAYRDRAILWLLAGLGLRAGEVATLELDDLDWHTGQLRLRSGKCRRERVLPLPQEVGAALAEYLRHGRPQHRDRRVFLTLTDPVRIFQAAVVSAIVRRNLVRAGVPMGRLTGAHMLRHTAASRMINGGAGLKEVADVLGHRSLQTTGLYAKLDLDALAGVALPWIGGGQ